MEDLEGSEEQEEQPTVGFEEGGWFGDWVDGDIRVGEYIRVEVGV